MISNKKDSMKQKIKILGVLYLVVSILAVIAVYFLGEWLLTLLYNKDYVQSISIVKITIIAIIPNAFYLLLRNPLDGVSKFPYNTICLVISFAVYIGLLMNAKSMEFCAIALIVAYTILGGLSLIFWKKAVK
jgi:O-antigen/teichoic acid export membrane protein